MRCNNCGWDNNNDVSHCIKCNTPLEVVKHEPTPIKKNENSFAKTIADNLFANSASSQEVGGPEVFAATAKEGQSSVELEKDILLPCPNPDCGYLNSKMVKVCPKCKTPLQNNEDITKTDATKTAYPANGASSQDRDFSINAGTIDPYRTQKESNPECGFELIQKEGELLENDAVHKTFVFDKSPIELNRSNLDEKNNSITSKIQAELSYENGKWYLTDKSELKTTFIKVLEKTALKNGDLILMGDRKFVFNCNQEQP